MFVMMNDARLKVALQGISLTEAAYQAAVDYAGIRIQGEGKNIIKHGNVLQDLVSIKAHIDGYRLMAYDLAVNLDISKKHPDASARKMADQYAALMTPVAKACMTDFACVATQKSIQVHGGMGFIKETGVEQFYRDALIATIYEGTNDIQSHDFVFRKAFDQNGNSNLDPYVSHVLKGAHAAVEKDLALADSVQNLERTAQLLDGATISLQAKLVAGLVNGVKADARDYTALFGAFAVGASWLDALTKTDKVARQNGITDTFIENKKTLGRYYLEHDMLPEAMCAALRISSNGRFSALSADTLKL
jgi:acyl-CoA dehydrogenase